MKPCTAMSRRRMLLFPAALTMAGFSEQSRAAGRPKVATIITEYRRLSHADVIVGRMLDGYEFRGEHREPQIDVVSMYTDQVPDNDMSRALAKTHGFRIYPSIRDALTMGGKTLAVDGIVLIGEHGKYPFNEKGQHLYPRYELFRGIVESFRETGNTVPVFTDKHLSYDWTKAKWMYDQARELGFPLMAGSSLPVACRRPQLELEQGAKVRNAVVTFYGGTESYGFHALESLQCMVERREGGETGIEAVQCIEGDRVWEWTDRNRWAAALLEHSTAVCPERKAGALRENVKEPVLFLVDYKSGLRTALYRLNGHVASFAFAADVAGKPEPVSCQFFLELEGNRAHFSGLVYHIERMMLTGKPSYPVERTLLTTGALDALMDSAYESGKRVETPHLAIIYRAPEQSLYNPAVVPMNAQGDS